MLARRERLRMHAALALAVAGIAIVATGGPGDATAPARPDSYGGDATAAAFEFRVDKTPSPFPVITDPFHVWFPYAETSIDSSGGASGIASSIYPGQDVIGAPALICQFAAQLCNSLPGGVPDYPAWASAQYPSQPDASATLSQKPFPGTGPFELTPHSVTAHADPNRVEATTITAAAQFSGVVETRSASAHSEQHFEGGTLVETAESVLKGVDIGGGVLHIDVVRSVASAKVDGGRVHSSSALTTVSGATLAGTPVTIDSTGVHAAGKGDNGAVRDQVNSALAALASQGIDARSLADTKAAKVGTVKAATGGLLVTYKRTITLPAEPPPPVPSPDGDYFGTFTLGGAGVSAFASPAVPFGAASVNLPPTGGAGPQPAANPAVGAPPGSTATAATGSEAAPAPAVAGSSPTHRPSLLAGFSLTGQRLRTLMLVLLAYPVLVLLAAPLRAPSRFPRLR